MHVQVLEVHEMWTLRVLTDASRCKCQGAQEGAGTNCLSYQRPRLVAELLNRWLWVTRVPERNDPYPYLGEVMPRLGQQMCLSTKLTKDTEFQNEMSI